VANRGARVRSRRVEVLQGAIVADANSADTWPASEVSVLIRKRRRSIVHLLSLVLLIAQLGMQAHAYSHLKSDPDGLPGSTTQVCGQCASSAPLLTMASGSLCIRVPHLAQAEGIAPASIDSPVHRLPHPAFRSRAPPHLL
jgi:hypothetical protein